MSPWVGLRFQKPKPISFLLVLCLEVMDKHTNYISSAMPVYLFPMFPALMVMFLSSETVSPNKFAWNMMTYYDNRRKLIWDVSLLPPLSCLLLLPSHNSHVPLFCILFYITVFYLLLLENSLPPLSLN